MLSLCATSAASHSSLIAGWLSSSESSHSSWTLCSQVQMSVNCVPSSGHSMPASRARASLRMPQRRSRRRSIACSSRANGGRRRFADQVWFFANGGSM